MTPIRSNSLSAASPLHKEVEGTLDALRAAVRKLLHSVPTRIQRATDLQQALEVRAPLAWQIFRVSEAGGPGEMVAHIPLPEAMSKFLDAARRGKCSKSSVDAVTRAYANFQELVERHAGDRASFDAMVVGLSPAGGEQIDLKARRSAFRASAQFWGLQAQRTYRCLIAGLAAPNEEPLSVIIQGSRKVRALRPKMSLPICRRTVTMTSTLREGEWKPEPAGVGLLEDFCSANLPRITTKERGSVAHDFITFSGVGNTNEIDVFLATKLRSGLDEREPDLGVTSMIRTPCEEFVADLLVPAGVLNPKTAMSRVCGCMEDVSAAETAADEYMIAPPQPAEYLGHNIEALHDEVFPRCPELIRFVLRDMGRSRVVYDVFRTRVRYPMLHTCIALNVKR